MSKKRAAENELGELHSLLARVLSEQINLKDDQGRVNGAALNVARQFLKDNGIDCDISDSKELQTLKEELPFDDVVVPIKQQWVA